MICQRLLKLLWKRCLLQSVFYFRCSATQKKVLQSPDVEKVHILRQRFPGAKNIIHELFTPLTQADENYSFHMESVPHLNGRCWKTHLHFRWPQVFTVTGQSLTQQQAEENAYLLACELFKGVGVLQDVGCNETGNTGAMLGHFFLLTHLERLASQYCRPPMFQFISTCTGGSAGEKGGLQWHSELRIAQPFNISSSGSGSSQDIAQQVASLNACMKLKLLGFLSHANLLNMTKVQKLMTNMYDPCLPAPDFSLFVDASMLGYGALLTPSNPRNSKARWISDTWPEEVKQSIQKCGQNVVGFLEFYAAVAAVYTWKHKFVDKDVLLWSDSQQVVQLINKGAHQGKKDKQSNCIKTLAVLQQTCQKNNIRVRAQHLSRYDNVAADILSRLDLDKFHAVVPDAHTKPKKTKKLLFFLPFHFKEDGC